MRKLFIICIALFTIGGFANSYAHEMPNQNVANTYQNNIYYINFMHYSSTYGLCFFDNGYCRHWTPANAKNCRSGKYYVQNQIIYITWDNGQQERVELKYDDRGNAYINYRGRTYYDGYNAR